MRFQLTKYQVQRSADDALRNVILASQIIFPLSFYLFFTICTLMYCYGLLIFSHCLQVSQKVGETRWDDPAKKCVKKMCRKMKRINKGGL